MCKFRKKSLADKIRLFFLSRFSLIFFLPPFYILISSCNGEALWLWGDKYVARVNEDVITEYDFKKRLEGFHTIKDIGDKMHMDIAGVDYHKILDEMIDDKLIVQESLRIGLDKTPAFTGDYKLSKLNLSLYRLKKEEILDTIKVTEDEIQKRYIDIYEAVKLRHFFTKDPKKGERILEEIKGGAEFSKLVESESEDIGEIKKRGGDVGFKRRVELPKEIADVAFGLKEGETSGLIKSEHGFHIIRVEERKAPSGNVPERDRRQIERLIFNEKEREKNGEYLANLRKKAKIVIDEPVLKTIGREDIFDGGKGIAGMVDEETIKRDEVLAKLRSMPEFKNEDELDKFKKYIMDSLIIQKLLDLEVAKKNYEADKDFSYTLLAMREAILSKVFKEKIIGTAIKIDEGEIKKYYEDNKEKFKDLESSKRMIIESIFKERHSQLLADYLKKLRANSKVKVNETVINRFIKPKKKISGQDGKENIH